MKSGAQRLWHHKGPIACSQHIHVLLPWASPPQRYRLLSPQLGVIALAPCSPLIPQIQSVNKFCDFSIPNAFSSCHSHCHHFDPSPTSHLGKQNGFLTNTLLTTCNAFVRQMLRLTKKHAHKFRWRMSSHHPWDEA